jgi:hypothetical protein
MEPLRNIPDRQLPFQVPEPYFRDLPMRVQARVQAGRASKPRLAHAWRWLAAPALAACLFWMLRPEADPAASPESAATILASVSDEALADYLASEAVGGHELKGWVEEDATSDEAASLPDELLEEIDLYELDEVL